MSYNITVRSAADYASYNGVIEYGVHHTPFGMALIVISETSIYKLVFVNNNAIDNAISCLSQQWLSAKYIKNDSNTKLILDTVQMSSRLSLIVRGTDFQISVWQALLNIQAGETVSYSDIAATINNPKSVRAVGQAIGVNPIAFAIPCHRVCYSLP